jgi:hypothetical protein
MKSNKLTRKIQNILQGERHEEGNFRRHVVTLDVSMRALKHANLMAGKYGPILWS